MIWKAGRSTTYVSGWRLLSIFNSAEGSANNAIAIELLDDLERCRVFRPLIDHGTAPALRDFDLRGARPILPGERSGHCSLLNQQALRVEKEFELDHGFHRTPLVPDCLEALQYVSPGVARSAQSHLPNKSYSLCCAAQYYWRARADTELRINWEVRHGHLTPCRCPSSIRARTFRCVY